MSDTPEKQLILAAASVARAAPDSFQRLLGAVSIYSQLQATNLVRSPLELLPVAQGRAQAIASLHELLVNCLTSAEQIESKRK